MLNAIVKWMDRSSGVLVVALPPPKNNRSLVGDSPPGGKFADSAYIAAERGHGGKGGGQLLVPSPNTPSSSHVIRSGLWQCWAETEISCRSTNRVLHTEDIYHISIITLWG